MEANALPFLFKAVGGRRSRKPNASSAGKRALPALGSTLDSPWHAWLARLHRSTLTEPPSSRLGIHVRPYQFRAHHTARRPARSSPDFVSTLIVRGRHIGRSHQQRCPHQLLDSPLDDQPPMSVPVDSRLSSCDAGRAMAARRRFSRRIANSRPV